MSLISWYPVSATSCLEGTSLDHTIQNETMRTDIIDEEMMWESSRQSSYAAAL